MFIKIDSVLINLTQVREVYTKDKAVVIEYVNGDTRVVASPNPDTIMNKIVTFIKRTQKTIE